jgi:hypothetical protein
MFDGWVARKDTQCAPVSVGGCARWSAGGGVEGGEQLMRLSGEQKTRVFHQRINVTDVSSVGSQVCTDVRMGRGPIGSTISPAWHLPGEGGQDGVLI